MIEVTNGLETKKQKKKNIRPMKMVPTVTLKGTAFCRRLYLLVRYDSEGKQCLFHYTTLLVYVMKDNVCSVC